MEKKEIGKKGEVCGCLVLRLSLPAHHILPSPSMLLCRPWHSCEASDPSIYPSSHPSCRPFLFPCLALRTALHCSTVLHGSSPAVCKGLRMGPRRGHREGGDVGRIWGIWGHAQAAVAAHGCGPARRAADIYIEIAMLVR